MGIQGLGRKLLTLLQYKFIKIGKYGRIEADTVFHQQNQLHAHLFYVMLQIHLVFDQLNDRHQQIGISQPTEHIVECTQIFVCNPFGNTMTERCQDDNRYLFVLLLNMTPDIKTIVISRTRHANHQIERYTFKLPQRLFFGGNL